MNSRSIVYFSLGVALIAVVAFNMGCAMPTKVIEPKEEIKVIEPQVQNQMDAEIEAVKRSNEAYRKMKAAGCGRENLLLVDMEFSGGEGYFLYECRLESGTTLVAKKVITAKEEKWYIYGKTQREKN